MSMVAKLCREMTYDKVLPPIKLQTKTKQTIISPILQ